jgi:hypothetical protein
MLRLRLASGLLLDLLDGPGRAAAARAAADGLLDPAALDGGRAVLTRRGRLLADGVVHALLAGAPALARCASRPEARESAGIGARVGRNWRPNVRFGDATSRGAACRKSTFSGQ